jgi:hypothetical protein
MPNTLGVVMNARRQRSRKELESLLDEQLRFLKSSARSFDDGFEGEAKRLALTVRVLLHDTDRQRSLLGLLDAIPEAFLDTACADEPGNTMAHHGLVSLEVTPHGARYAPMLDDSPVANHLQFEEWWRAPVFRDPEGGVLDRRGLILVAADQDGGAHVDPSLDETYAHLSSDNAMGWVWETPGHVQPMPGPEMMAIRQIAHEVLRSIDPEYCCARARNDQSMTIGAVRRFDKRPDRIIDTRGVGRNDDCPCGSGIKFKRCHGR